LTQTGATAPDLRGSYCPASTDFLQRGARCDRDPRRCSNELATPNFIAHAGAEGRIVLARGGLPQPPPHLAPAVSAALDDAADVGRETRPHRARPPRYASHAPCTMTLGRPKRTKKRQLEAQDSVPHDGASESEFDDAESPSGDESDVVSHDGASESKPREAQEIRADFERRKAEILAALKKPAKPALVEYLNAIRDKVADQWFMPIEDGPVLKDRTPEAIAERAALSSFSIAERAVLKPPKPPKPPTEMAPYSAVEDERIVSLVKTYGTERWSKIAEEYNKMLSEGDCRRNDKQIRGRYVWQLDPNISRDEWTDDEIKIIREMQARLGNKWVEIAKQSRERRGKIAFAESFSRRAPVPPQVAGPNGQ